MIGNNMNDIICTAKTADICFLIFQLKQHLNQYEQEETAKSKREVLKKASLISSKINTYFDREDSKHNLMNEIKSNSVEIINYQIAFRAKKL